MKDASAHPDSRAERWIVLPVASGRSAKLLRRKDRKVDLRELQSQRGSGRSAPLSMSRPLRNEIGADVAFKPYLRTRRLRFDSSFYNCTTVTVKS
jgi:hypothetical protein